MSRTNAITLTVLGAALASAGCAGTGECEDCVEDHTGAPDGGAGDPDDPAGGPTIEVLPTEVIDEVDDTVIFTSAGVPRTFEHRGERVALGGAGCPVFHKHAFLLRRDHGADESPRNPVELRFQVAADPEIGADPDGAAYRVRVQGESDYLTDWLPTAEKDGAFIAGLDRGAVPELGVVRGPLEIELRGRDRSGREASAMRCVDLRPLAGPLDVAQAEAVPRFSLQDDDPIAPMLNGQGAWPMIRLQVRNGTRDPVFATFSRSAAVTSCSKEWQRWTVLGSITSGAGSQSCDDNPSLCVGPSLESEIDHDSPVACSPTPSSSAFDLRVAVDGAAAAPCPGCDAGQYRLPAGSTAVVSLVAVDVPGLQPREPSEPEETYADQDVMYRTGSFGDGTCPGSSDCRTMEITGRVTTRSGCTRTAEIGGELFCTERKTYKIVRALTEASATFGPVSIDVDGVALEAGGPENAPTSYGAPRTVSGYFWLTSAGSKVPDA